MLKSLLALSIGLFVAASAGAHSGHGQIANATGLGHYFAEPIHAFAFVAAIAGALVVAGRTSRRRRA